MRIIVIFLALFFFGVGSASARETEEKIQALTHYILGVVYEEQDEINQAIIEYKSAAQFDVSSSSVHLRLACVYLKDNNFKEAIKHLKETLQYNPDSFEAHGLLSVIYSLNGEEKAAFNEYELALKGALSVDPTDISIHKELAVLYLKQDKFLEARKICEFILESYEEAEIYFLLGTIYEQEGDKLAAIEQFKKGLSLNPDYPNGLNSLGYLYAEEGINLKEAKILIKKALEFEPDNAAYIDSLGWVYFKEGKYKLAVEELEKAIKLLEDPVIYEHLGDAYFKRKQTNEAQEMWKRALELNPGVEEIKEKLRKVK